MSLRPSNNFPLESFATKSVWLIVLESKTQPKSLNDEQFRLLNLKKSYPRQPYPNFIIYRCSDLVLKVHMGFEYIEQISTPPQLQFP